MIANDGTIIYEAILPPFLEWRPPSSVLRDFLLAFITTLISFQSAATLIDLSFGLKRSGQASISNIQSLVLVRAASPRQIVKNLFPQTFHRFLSSSRLKSLHDTKSTPIHTSIRPTVLIKLLSLLAAVPLLNIIPLILVFEYDTFLSLSEARVGAFGIGINMDFTSEASISTSLICTRNQVQVRDREIALLDFKTCDSQGFIGAPLASDVGFIRVQGEGSRVTLFVGTNELTAWSSKSGFLDVNPTALNGNRQGNRTSSFGVYHSLTEKSASELIRYGRTFMDKSLCKTSDDISSFTTSSVVPAPGPEVGFSLQVTFSCTVGHFGGSGTAVRAPTETRFPLNAPDELKIVAVMLKKVTFVTNDETKLISGSGNIDEERRQLGEGVISGDDLPFLKRRRSYASFWTLVTVLSVVLVVRLIVAVVARNDLETGLGLVIRDFLGLPCCDSMFPHSDVTISYEHDVIVVKRKQDKEQESEESMNQSIEESKRDDDIINSM